MEVSHNIKDIRLNFLVKSKFNCRNHTDQETIENLIISLKKGDILPPILCRSPPSSPGCFEIIQGQHRVEAYRACKHKFVPAYIKEMTDAEALEASVRENTGRCNLKILEICNLCLNFFQQGKDKKSIAEIMNIKPNECTRYIKYAYFLSDDIKPLIETSKQTLIDQIFQIKKEYQLLVFKKFESYKTASLGEIFRKYKMKNPHMFQRTNITKIPKTSQMLEQICKNDFKNVAKTQQFDELNMIEKSKNVTVNTSKKSEIVKLSIDDNYVYIDKKGISVLLNVIPDSYEFASVRELFTKYI